ncbi:iojap-like protein [Candidatus Uzinura diaspidicola str. ASNER]|uniref:Ribosomal silencing factor RsfS n=1 Tax=Candidatus Uzinura diaspidicola str. ASNER TaxID=1133592 RepID=L7VK85_9FLAO|nr:iojap-like protein [Candidatus Uzinura diaspidicola str. ASNER]
MKLDNYSVLKAILNSIEKIKGTNIKIINLTKIENILFDYILICSASSSIQVSSIVSSVKEKIIGEKPFHIEGLINAQWVLMDYDNILVNIFQKSIRKYYDLETLWLKRLLKKKMMI